MSKHRRPSPPVPPVPPGLRPVEGGATHASPATDRDEIAAVVREFGANRVALAAEVVRLRNALQDALFELSRRAADCVRVTQAGEPVRVVIPPSPPPSAPPFGLPRPPAF